MQNKYFSADDTIFTLTEKYPETIEVFSGSGFKGMEDPKKRKAVTSKLKLKIAVMLKDLDYDSFSKLLVSTIEQKRGGSDITLEVPDEETSKPDISLVGLLPCPVRIPLLETLNKFIETYQKDTGLKIKHELKAASMGLDWVESHLSNISGEEDIPDLFISAGFDMFFDEQMIGGLKKQGVFKDYSPLTTYNETFNDLDLKDPQGHYTMMSAVPAIFLVNTDILGDRKMPLSWEDILAPEFENSVSIPVGDFDLFNAILLNIYHLYGDDGVRKMGKSLLKALHPSEMIKTAKQKVNKPAITVMPYFFSRMAKEGGPLRNVWPKEGAIMSPIFMLTKSSKQKELKPLVDFFMSKEIGDILGVKGLFPSVNPEVDNGIPPENKFLWLGWDYIYSNDIAAQIKHCIDVFEGKI